MPAVQCPVLPDGWQLSLPQVKTLLQGRRSIRSFSEEPVSREDIEALVDAARYAPSGINRQPVSWSVVNGREKVRVVAQFVIEWMQGLIEEQSPLAASLRMEAMAAEWHKGQDRICRGAPHMIIAYALKDDMTAAQACTIALSYLELAAVSRGLGACWAGYVAMAVNHYPPLKEFIGLRKRHNCYGAIMLGYPRYRYYRVPARNAARIIWR
jgi:nitroreductase